MIITGITVEQFRLAVARAGMRYGDNLRVEIEDEFGQTRFNARVLPIVTGYQMGLPPGELAPGEKRRQGWFTNTLCWHAEHDVLIEIFNINANAKVRTMYANYIGGAEEFLREYPRTARINVGPTAYPVMPVQCCDCEAHEPAPCEEQEMIQWWAEQRKRVRARTDKLRGPR